MKTKSLLPLSLALSLCLAGCGGGGGGGSSSTPAATPTPPNAGLWAATTSSGRTGNIILLDDGSYYFLYTMSTDPTTLGGAIQGHAGASASGSSIASVDGIDFSWERGDGTLTTMAGSLDAVGMSGNITYGTDTARNFSFTSTYQPASGQLTPLTDVAGAFISKDGSMSLEITSTGAITGEAFSKSCAFTGTVTPTNNYKTIMSMSITFRGGICSFGTSTIKGIALYNAGKRELLGIAVNTDRTSTALFQASKL